MAFSRKVARLRMRLKGFQEPDTTSQFEGHLEPGNFHVLEVREGFPTSDTDYVRVLAPGLGASDTWICSRWREQRYADITEAVERSAPTEFDVTGDPLSLSEEALIGLLPQFNEFTYDPDEGRYPQSLPGIRVPQSPPAHNNCCTFVEALLVGAWAQAHGERLFEWSAERHRQMMIMSTDDFFSPVTASVESGMAMLVDDPDLSPQPWTIVQGWREQWRRGHTFLIVDHDPQTDRVLTLESNSAYRLNGVGFRMLGNLRDQPDGRPPARWWERPELWTWARVCATYRFRQQAALKVTDRRWSGLETTR